MNPLGHPQMGHETLLKMHPEYTGYTLGIQQGNPLKQGSSFLAGNHVLAEQSLQLTPRTRVALCCHLGLQHSLNKPPTQGLAAHQVFWDAPWKLSFKKAPSVQLTA
jgi:hypothetical protein